jgi:TetR/AcrR family transcriptional regulator, regulator of autoinduction and epiphytic fitness
MNSDKKLTELKREDIIKAAIHEFRTSGFKATSMDRIAKTAQVSKRTVYNHFENKEALFQAITQEICDNATHVSDYTYDPDTPIETQLQAIATNQMKLLTSDELLSTLRMITSESLASPELTQENFENFEENGFGVVKWIKKATKDGKLLVKDPVMAGKQFIGLIDTFALWPQLYGIKSTLKKSEQKKVIDSTVVMFMNAYCIKD